MDGSHFDDLARSLATSTSRRRFIGGLAGGILGLAGVRAAGAATCRGAGLTCNAEALCCSRVCGPKDDTGRRRCVCPTDTTDCNGQCVNPKTVFQSDVSNCGTCGVKCPRTKCQLAVCAAGVCGLAPDPKAVGKSCDDGNSGTGNDVCQPDGSCKGVPKDCSGVGDQCNDGVYDPAKGKCVQRPRANGAPCDDGNACTQTDTCQNGVCEGGNPVVCTASDQCHLAGTCDPATGSCSNPAKANGAACDDGDACTRTDTCQNGSCVGSNLVVCSASDQCHVAGTCDPKTGICSDPAAPNGTACDDGDRCTQTDTCQDGACVGTNPVVCTELDACHVACTCDPTTGTCSHPDADDGTPCHDGNACTVGDTCQAGVCVGGAALVCNSQSPCIVDSCEPATGCVQTFKDQGVSCADDNRCDGDEICNGQGACVAGTAITCAPPADIQCQESGVCDAETGTCSYANKSNDTTCTHANKCYQSASCQEGVCTGTDHVACTASDQCHVAGVCDPANGTCSNPNAEDGIGCDDVNACTTGTTCTAGVCGGGELVSCDDGNPCTIDTCNPTTGCVHTAKVCDDGNACTTGICDVTTGNCVYTPIECKDGNLCTVDTCDPVSGCLHNPVTCQPLDQCHVAGVCNPATGTCSNPNANNGTTCPLPHATASCQEGVCTVATCAPGFANCNGNQADGCETDATTLSNCGKCGNVCTYPANSTPSCVDGACYITCADGMWLCGNQCKDTSNDPNNCGNCATACPSSSVHATSICKNGQCQITACDIGYADCDGSIINGCETYIYGTDLNNCGWCGNTCGPSPANGTMACTGGSCLVTCNNGYTLCGGQCVAGCTCCNGQCVDPTDVTNCGRCGRTCPAPLGGNGIATCSNGQCGIQCNNGYRNCGGYCCPNNKTCCANGGINGGCCTGSCCGHNILGICCDGGSCDEGICRFT